MGQNILISLLARVGCLRNSWRIGAKLGGSRRCWPICSRKSIILSKILSKNSLDYTSCFS
jgi:hypothetical protein